MINNNKRKNTFAQRIKVGESSIKDLSRDIDEETLVEDFERVLNGEETDDIYFKPKIVEEYLVKTIGTYSKEDIKNNFDFILYDTNSNNSNSLDDRRKINVDIVNKKKTINNLLIFIVFFLLIF